MESAIWQAPEAGMSTGGCEGMPLWQLWESIVDGQWQGEVRERVRVLLHRLLHQHLHSLLHRQTMLRMLQERVQTIVLGGNGAVQAVRWTASAGSQARYECSADRVPMRYPLTAMSGVGK